MKPTLLTSIAIACSLTHWACAPAKPSPRSSPKAEHAECEGSGTQRWDLGAGRLEDIAEYAPDFYDFSSPNANYERLFRLKIAALPTCQSPG